MRQGQPPMSAPKKWDDLGDGWTVRAVRTDPTAAVDSAGHLLASESGMHALGQLLAADRIWRNLSKPQRELLLSTWFGMPVRARRDVVDRLIARGLLVDDPSFDDPTSCITDAGRLLLKWRPHR